MWKTGLPPDLVLNIVGGALGHLPGQAVGKQISGYSLMGRNPPERDLVTSVGEAGVDLDDGPGLLLSRPQDIRKGPPDRRLRVRENHVPTAGLLARLKDLQSLVDGKGLGVKDILVGAQMEAPAGPILAPLAPSASRTHLSAIESRAVSPDNISSLGSVPLPTLGPQSRCKRLPGYGGVWSGYCISLPVPGASSFRLYLHKYHQRCGALCIPLRA